MRRFVMPFAFSLLAFSVAGATAGTTSDHLTGQSHVNKDCVADVYGYVADGSAPLRGQARFDHFKKPYVNEPNATVLPFVNFVAIGGKRAVDDDPQALPQCGSSASLP